jgi:hypothetical protein
MDRQVVIVFYLQKAGKLYIVYDTDKTNGKSRLDFRQSLGFLFSLKSPDRYEPTKPSVQWESRAGF